MQSEDKAHDHFRDFTITGVRAAESGDSWSLSLSDRTGMSLSRSDFDRDVPRDLAPRVGETVRLYGRGFGHEIRGVDLNSRQLYYRTQAECDLRDWRREIDQVKEQRERFNRERSELDATVAALSAPLRARIERLRAEDPDFRWKWEAMMLPIYVDAELHGGHSGASFGEACQLAFALLAGLPVSVTVQRFPPRRGWEASAAPGRTNRRAPRTGALRLRLPAPHNRSETDTKSTPPARHCSGGPTSLLMSGWGA